MEGGKLLFKWKDTPLWYHFRLNKNRLEGIVTFWKIFILHRMYFKMWRFPYLPLLRKNWGMWWTCSFLSKVNREEVPMSWEEEEEEIRPSARVSETVALWGKVHCYIRSIFKISPIIEFMYSIYTYMCKYIQSNDKNVIYTRTYYAVCYSNFSL